MPHQNNTDSSFLDRIKDWVLQNPHDWWLLSLLSAVVGFICFAVSFFIHHVEPSSSVILKFCLISIGWNAFILIAVFIGKKLPGETYPWAKAHFVFLVIIGTYVATFFLDKQKEEGADVYGLVSYGAFAVMFFSLALQTQLGFPAEVVYFFLGILLTRLMRIHWWLVFPAACFCYPFIIFSSFLDELPQEERHLPVSDPSLRVSPALAVASPPSASPVASPPSAYTQSSHLDDNSSIGFSTPMSPQQSSDTDTDTGPARASQPVPRDLVNRFSVALRRLDAKNSELAMELQSPLNDYITGKIHQIPEKLMEDSNFLMDRILPEVPELKDLMINSGQFEEDIWVVNEYSKSRKSFLDICEMVLKLNVTQRSYETNKKNETEKIPSWIKLSNIASRILFPTERTLCDLVFGSSSDMSDKCFMEVCSELAHDLLNFAGHFARNSVQYQQKHLFQVFRTLQCDLITPSLELLFSNNTQLWTEAKNVEERLCRAIEDYYFSAGLEDLAHENGRKHIVLSNRVIHPITVQIMDRLSDALNEKETLELILRDYPLITEVKEGMTWLSTHISWMIDRLETHLENYSKMCRIASLGCVYLINNFRYIARKVRDTELHDMLGDIWHQEQNAKFNQYLEEYRRNSWDKVLDYLKLDSENVTAESMTEKIQLFNNGFRKMLHVQGRWSVDDRELKEHITKSVSAVFVPAYENFIDKFRDILGDQADKYIEHSTSEVEQCLGYTLHGYESDVEYNNQDFYD